MNPVLSPPTTTEPLGETGWSLAGLFLEALSRRDFVALGDCLDPGVRFRALVPPGPFELVGAAATTERFRRWFGGEDDFELVDAAIGQVGPRLYLRWRARLVAVDAPHVSRIVEQHAFLTARDAIADLDLLCSGFHAETGSSRPTQEES